MSRSTERREENKARREEDRAKRAFQLAGLTWDSDQSIRAAGFAAASQEVDMRGIVSSTAINSLVAAGAGLTANPVVALAAAGRALSQVQGAWQAFQEAFNQAVETARRIKDAIVEPEPEAAPRYQVPLDIAYQLPEQVRQTLREEEAKTEIPAWLLPAAGIAALYFITRK